VATPHIGGWPVLYRREGQHLAEIGRWHGYSNHAIDSTVWGMSAVVDANDDGVTDIVVPAQDRSVLKVLTLAGGVLTELQSVKHMSAIATSFVVANLDEKGRKDIVYGLEDGGLMAIWR
jgi:hypothetical protein